eukprot:scaffold2390_cov23-Tisochrysis_lutea.AAC.1
MQVHLSGQVLLGYPYGICRSLNKVLHMGWYWVINGPVCGGPLKLGQVKFAGLFHQKRLSEQKFGHALVLQVVSWLAHLMMDASCILVGALGDGKVRQGAPLGQGCKAPIRPSSLAGAFSIRQVECVTCSYLPRSPSG